MKFCKKAWVGLRRVVFAGLRWSAILVIEIYRLVFRGWLGGVCRFEPTCSEYAESAFRNHPPFRALFLSVRRLLRCHPWGPFGIDPVPRPVSKVSCHE